MNSENNQTDELTLEPFKDGDDESQAFNDPYQSIKGKRMLIIGSIAGGLLFILLLYFFFKDNPIEVSSTKQAAPKQKGISATYTYNMPEIVTNMSPNNEKDSWIKLSITMQLENNKDHAVLDKKLPIIKDAIIVFLRELRASDLASSGGSMMIKNELLKRINKIMYPVKLRDVLLREIMLDK